MPIASASKSMNVEFPSHSFIHICVHCLCMHSIFPHIFFSIFFLILCTFFLSSFCSFLSLSFNTLHYVFIYCFEMLFNFVKKVFLFFFCSSAYPTNKLSLLLLLLLQMHFFFLIHTSFIFILISLSFTVPFDSISIIDKLAMLMLFKSV